MPSDSSLVSIRKAFQAVAGLESLTAMDGFFFEHSLNRACQRAFDTSTAWPRYITVSEKRMLGGLTISGTETATALHQSYRLLGKDTNGFNVYEGLTLTNVHVFYESSSTKWAIKSGSTATKSSGVWAVTGGAFVALSNVTTETNVASDDITWSIQLEVENLNLIPFTSREGKGNIGQFIRIHRKQAFLNDSTTEYDFYVDSDGAHVLNSRFTDDTAHVTYKKDTTFSFDEDSTNVPNEFVDYILYSVLSDFYTGDGQTEKAMIATDTAEKMLNKELFKIDINTNNTITKRKISTYVNTSTR
jgi:hypothetical protein